MSPVARVTVTMYGVFSFQPPSNCRMNASFAPSA